MGEMMNIQKEKVRKELVSLCLGEFTAVLSIYCMEYTEFPSGYYSHTNTAFCHYRMANLLPRTPIL